MQTIHTIAELKAHVRGVLERASRHHVPPEVLDIAQTLVGGIVAHADDGSIQHMGKPDIGGNIVWCDVNGERVAYCYNRSTRRIEVRDRTQQGNALTIFHNVEEAVRFNRALGANARNAAA